MDTRKHTTRRLALAAIAAALLPVFAHAESRAALTPPMGWNPWNAFRTEVSEDKIMAVAAKLKSAGLADAGYRYVNIDDGWWLKRRADGRIEVRTSMFPSADLGGGKTSLRPFVDRLHAMGLKAGIYTDIGRNACSQAWDAKSPNLPVGTQLEREVGAYGFEAQDMRLLFGEWNFDYVKVDACGLADYVEDRPHVRSGSYRAFGPFIVRGKPERSNAPEVEKLYAQLSRELAAVRPQGDYVLSICAWGEAQVSDWAGKYGNLWRTSPDIRGTWASMLHNFDSAADRPLYAGPGRWNDPDMLKVGIGEFDGAHLTEARAHMSMWAIIAAPLILGADLTRAPQGVLDIMGNREVIAINQDPAGHQGVTVARDGDTQVIVKTLSRPGSKAVALINRGSKPRRAAVDLARLHLDPAARVTVRDLWSGKTSTLEGGRIAADLGPRETVLLVVQGSPRRLDAAYVSEMPARVRVLADGADALPPALRARWVPVQANSAPSGEALVVAGKPVLDGIGALVNSRLELRLDGEFRRFRASAGTMPSGALGGAAEHVTWRVYGDGKPLFARNATDATIDLPVAGVRRLELVAEGAPGAAGLVAWGGAELSR
jgi:alpha-galactosidase